MVVSNTNTELISELDYVMIQWVYHECPKKWYVIGGWWSLKLLIEDHEWW